MKKVIASEARNNFCKLLDEAVKSHKPILIKGKTKNAVLLSEDYWNSIQATLYLLSIPGMKESNVKGMKEGVRKSSIKLNW